jgi:hypothetical protein
MALELFTPSFTALSFVGGTAGAVYVVSPRPSPIVNHVLKGIVIMFYRLVSQVLISWRLMCL